MRRLNKFLSKTNLVVGAVLILFMTTSWLLISIETVELFYETTKKHENWQLDEIILIIFSALLFGTIGLSVKLSIEIRERHRKSSKLFQLMEELKQTAMTAESANVAMSQFLATMGDEVRTPLRQIIGYLELLHESADSLEPVELLAELKRITTSARQLLALLNDVLRLSRTEAERMELELGDDK